MYQVSLTQIWNISGYNSACSIYTNTLIYAYILNKQSQYTCAAEKEDYETAVRLQVEITAASQNDGAARLMSNLNVG